MAHTKLLPDSFLDPVTDQIAHLFSGLISEELMPGKVELSESFNIRLLDTNKILEPEIDFKDIVSPTDYWHHQILFDGIAKAYAESKEEKDNPSFEVLAVHLSDIAKRIDEAITWIDKQPFEDTLTELLIVPSYSVYAFWLKDCNKIYVIDSPPLFKHIRPKQLLSVEDFQNALVADLRVINMPRKDRSKRR